MAGKLQGKRIAFLMAPEGVEQVELTEPWKAVEEAGWEPSLISLRPGSIQAFEHYDKADAFDVDQVVAEASADDFDALVLPGGVGNPDELRTDEQAVDFVRAFVAAGKPIAAICHGPWVLVEAGAVEGRELTSWPSLATDIRNAGGTWVDREVVVDEGIVTSRNPDDLPAFCAKLREEFAEGIHPRETTAGPAS
jgi:protease I